MQCPKCKTHQSPKETCGWCGAPLAASNRGLTEIAFEEDRLVYTSVSAVVSAIRCAAEGANANGGMIECSAVALRSWADLIEQDKADSLRALAGYGPKGEYRL